MKLIINDREYEYKEGSRLLDIAADFAAEYEDDIVLASVDNKLKELWKEVKSDSSVQFLTARDKNGQRAYRRSVVFLMQKAIDNLYKDHNPDVEVKYSLGPGYYCKPCFDMRLDQTGIDELKAEMMRLAEADLRLKKFIMKTSDAAEMFRSKGMTNKEKLLKYRTSSNINMYELDGFCDYFYGFMVPSTKYLRYFDIKLYDEGFVLLFPSKDAKTIEEFAPANKLFNVLKTANEWSEAMEIPTVGALNDAVAHGKSRDIILMQEALMEQQIGDLASEIISDRSRKFVLIAGPSSSGKTTFANRLSTQLRAKGVHPHPLSLDDYYLDRELMPLDEFGQKDFEAIEGLNIKQFNIDMDKLLHGERVELPSFNFKTGKSEYRGHFMQLGPDDILVIEGIHGLNPRMTELLPDDSKYRIYISALTQLSIDEHNPLSTTDGRLLRRIVRDSRTRGTSAQETIAMWDSVRRGEEKNIFPFQEHADTMFNSALIYEMAVLKLYAEPQLYAIEPDCKEYAEAKRLIKLLDYFLPIPPDDIANSSLVREFIGGGCFGL